MLENEIKELLKKKIEYLNQKFERYKRSDKMEAWMIHKWGFYGADFGFIIQLTDGKFCMKTYEESGYVKEQAVIEELSEDQFWKIVQNIYPTNRSYKTD